MIKLLKFQTCTINDMNQNYYTTPLIKICKESYNQHFKLALQFWNIKYHLLVINNTTLVYMVLWVLWQWEALSTAASAGSWSVECQCAIMTAEIFWIKVFFHLKKERIKNSKKCTKDVSECRILSSWFMLQLYVLFSKKKLVDIFPHSFEFFLKHV